MVHVSPLRAVPHAGTVSVASTCCETGTSLCSATRSDMPLTVTLSILCDVRFWVRSSGNILVKSTILSRRGKIEILGDRGRVDVFLGSWSSVTRGTELTNPCTTALGFLFQEVAALVLDYGSGMSIGWFPWFDACSSSWLRSSPWTRLLTCPLLGTSGWWVRLLTCPLLCNDRCEVESVQETVEVPQLQCFDKVVDVPVMLVHTVQPVESLQVQFLDASHRQGVDVAVSMQRQGSSCPHWSGEPCPQGHLMSCNFGKSPVFCTPKPTAHLLLHTTGT